MVYSSIVDTNHMLLSPGIDVMSRQQLHRNTTQMDVKAVK